MRNVVITGASAGVGRAAAIAFAQRGCSVGLIARGTDRLAAAADDVAAAGGRPVVLPCDVADAGAVDDAAAAFESEAGPIDVWVNNAMVSVFAPVIATTADEIRRVTEVTYLGTVHGTMTALRRMTPRGSGTIVQVGSALAYRSIPMQAAYCGAKHATAGFTESLRTELLHERSGVRVTNVHLPAINTPQFDWVRSRLPFRAQPVPPIFQPEVAAEAIVWAAHRAPRELKVGWPTIRAVYADKFAPGLLDRFLAWRGIGAQQTDEPALAGCPDNLFAPVDRDVGAHGRFDDEAHTESRALQFRFAFDGLVGRAFRRS